MKRLAWLVLPLLSAATACQGKLDSGTPLRPGVGGVGGAGSAGSSSTSPGSFDLACSQAQLGSPVLRLLTATEFANTVTGIFPQVAGAWTNTLPANSVSAYGFANDSSAIVGPQLAQALLDTATSVASAVAAAPLATILPCAATAADRTCADTFVNQYGRRLFRRPLAQAEHDRYLTFFDSALAKSDFKTAIKWLTVGLIQSPNAVYRSEIGTLASDGSRALGANEIATEFAYTFTGTTPTDGLLTQAESGASVDRVALAKSLLATDNGKLTLQHFFEAYLGYPQVAAVERSNIPNFANLRTDMVRETRTFIDQVVVQSGGGLKDLLTASSTNPSRYLAAYYGFPAPSADYASVTRSSGRGIGLLSQGSILASRALPNSSSPTQRGLLVFSRLLCETKPTPPANVPPPPAVAPGKVTTRQRYEEQHASSGSCAGCHRLFDPIGFGFEHFDEGGRYRADEGGLAINTVSDVPNPDATPLFPFQDQETLAQGLAEQELVYQCFAAYLATYAFGTSDSCLGSSRVADFKAGTLGIADYFAALAAEPHFVQRARQ
jgi:mono/diheme cytochrome c family protein